MVVSVSILASAYSFVLLHTPTRKIYECKSEDKKRTTKCIFHLYKHEAFKNKHATPRIIFVYSLTVDNIEIILIFYILASYFPRFHGIYIQSNTCINKRKRSSKYTPLSRACISSLLVVTMFLM